jgi:hypothetical protein
MRGAFRHPPAATTGAHSPSLARKRHEAIEAAAVTAKAREAAGQPASAEKAIPSPDIEGASGLGRQGNAVAIRVATTIVSSGPHVAPLGDPSIVATVTAGPPVTATFFNVSPPTNPIH